MTRRVRMRTLVGLRALLTPAEILILAVCHGVLMWPVSVWPCLGLIATGAAMNLAIALSPSALRDARPWEITTQLSADILRLTALLFLTGGVVNPFALLLIFPISVGGNALPVRHAVMLCGLCVIAALLLAARQAAPPLTGAGVQTDGYRISRSLALVIALAFATAYAVWSATQSAQRELALHLTETVLAREQRLSALGGLAAAVAHELGTPLATIAIVATEMAREAPEGPLREDARLMVEQSRRCREILKRLAEEPEQKDALHERMTLLQFVREIVEPYAKSPEIRVEALVAGPSDMAAPDIWRRPEILHAIATMVENAYDFARGEILLTARFDADSVVVEVRDDGPGFAKPILARLGEPYVTSRPNGEGSRSGHLGMGLGVFIAKTLLERTGATVAFANGPKVGAIVTARWPRRLVEIAPMNL